MRLKYFMKVLRLRWRTNPSRDDGSSVTWTLLFPLLWSAPDLFLQKDR